MRTLPLSLAVPAAVPAMALLGSIAAETPSLTAAASPPQSAATATRSNGSTVGTATSSPVMAPVLQQPAPCDVYAVTPSVDHWDAQTQTCVPQS